MNRVLIVEDNEDERESLRDLLNFSGYRAEACATADEAEDLYRAFSPHAAVIDIGLPDGHGVELAFGLKQRDPALRIIVVSGYLDLWDPDDIRDCGSDRVLEKPYGSERLRQTLRELLSAEPLSSEF